MRVSFRVPPWGHHVIDTLSLLEQLARRQRRHALVAAFGFLVATTLIVDSTSNPEHWLPLLLFPVVVWAWIFGVRGGLIGALVTTAFALLIIPPASSSMLELAFGFFGIALFVGVAGRAVRRADKRAGVLERLVRMLGTLSPMEAPGSLQRQVVENAAAIANGRGGCLALWSGEHLIATEWWDGTRWRVAPYAWTPAQRDRKADTVVEAWLRGDVVHAEAASGTLTFCGRTVGALAAAPFGTVDGVERGVLVVFRESDNPFDQTDRAALHAFAVNGAVLLANARLYAEALSANSRRTTFVEQVSHELGTPLHVVRGCVDSLAELDLPAVADPYLEHLRRNLATLEQLVKETIEFTQLEDRRVEVVWTATSVSEIFAALRTRFETFLCAGVSLTTRIGKDAELVWTDSGKLYTILSNLTANAVKYTTKGSVQLSAEMRDGAVQISVADTGIGIDPLALPAIFEPFYRGSDASVSPGFGLGLTIAERLARALGSRLRVANAATGGSVFSLTLDLPPAAAAAEVCHDAA